MVHIFSLPLYVRVEKDVTDFLEKCASCSDDEIRFLEACNIPVRMVGKMEQIKGNEMIVRYAHDTRSLEELEENLYEYYSSFKAEPVEKLTVGGYYIFRETTDVDVSYYRVKVVVDDDLIYKLLAIDYGFIRSVPRNDVTSFFHIDPTFYEAEWHFAMAAIIHEPDAHQMKLNGLPRFNKIAKSNKPLTGEVFFLSPFEPMCAAVMPFNFADVFDMRKLITGDLTSLKWADVCTTPVVDAENPAVSWTAPPLHSFKHKHGTVGATVVNVHYPLVVKVRDVLTSLRLICLDEILNDMYTNRKNCFLAQIKDPENLKVGTVAIAYDTILQRYYRVKVTRKYHVENAGLYVDVIGLDYPICSQTMVNIKDLYLPNAPLSTLPILYQQISVTQPVNKTRLVFAEIMVRELIPSGAVIGIQNRERINFVFENKVQDLENVLMSVETLYGTEYAPSFFESSESCYADSWDSSCDILHDDHDDKLNIYEDKLNIYEDKRNFIEDKLSKVPRLVESGYSSANSPEPSSLYLTELPSGFERVYVRNVCNDGTITLYTEANAQALKQLHIALEAELETQNLKPIPLCDLESLPLDLFLVVKNGSVKRARFEADGQCQYIDYGTKVVIDDTFQVFEIPDFYTKQKPCINECYLFTEDSNLKMTSATCNLILKSEIYAVPSHLTKNEPIYLLAKDACECQVLYVDVLEFLRRNQMDG